MTTEQVRNCEPFLYKETKIVDIPTCRVLSLCSGVGGLDLGLKLAMPTSRTVAYMEIEAYACEILVKRMEEKVLDPAPLWSDVKSFDGRPWRGKVDLITGGYPCQPFSVAGKKLGDKDPRHLWPHVRRIVSEVEPTMCFFENVGGHLQLGFEQVHDDLQRLGYTVKAGLFTAEEIGAPHRRERLFILAYRNHSRCDSCRNNYSERYVCSDQERNLTEVSKNWTQLQFRTGENSKALADSCGLRSEWNCQKRSNGEQQKKPTESGSLIMGPKRKLDNTSSSESRKCISELQQRTETDSDTLANSKCLGCRRWRDGDQNENFCPDKTTGSFCTYSQYPLWPPKPTEYQLWRDIQEDLKPAIYRMADGMANRVDRIRACGNGVVPLVAAYAFTVLTSNLEFTTIGILNERES